MSRPTWAIENGTRFSHPAGAVHIGRYNSSGQKTGLRFPGSVKELVITPSEDEVEAYSAVDGARRLASSARLRRKLRLRAVLQEATMENLALLTAGDEWLYTQAATAVVGEAVANSTPGIQLDKAYRVAKTPVNSTPAVVVKEGAGTKVAGTDYIFDYTTGLLYIPPASTITPGATNVTIDYTPIAVTGSQQKRVTIGTATSPLIELHFVGDPSAGPTMELYVPRLQMSPSGDLALISEEYTDFTFEATFVSDPTMAALTPAQPYGWIKFQN